MGREKILIPEYELRRLYLDEKWTPARIGVQFSCTQATVRNRLREAGIPFKTKATAHNKYPKYDFTGSDRERAYMLGFKYGDLNAYKPQPTSETIVVRSHTTHAVQDKLFRNLFSTYGTITTSRKGNHIQSNAYLNNSFLFLLGKYPNDVRERILSKEKLQWDFTAGYVDAEGSFGLNQGRGRFKIDAYDYEILKDMNTFFHKKGVHSKFRIIAQKGENDYGWIWKQNVWRLSVNEAKSLETLIGELRPLLRHEKRIADACKVLENILQRRDNGTIR